jgi:hypothetical protein
LSVLRRRWRRVESAPTIRLFRRPPRQARANRSGWLAHGPIVKIGLLARGVGQIASERLDAPTRQFIAATDHQAQLPTFSGVEVAVDSASSYPRRKAHGSRTVGFRSAVRMEQQKVCSAGSAVRTHPAGNRARYELWTSRGAVQRGPRLIALSIPHKYTHL